MTAPVESILVALPEQTVARLMDRRRFPDERLADMVERLALTDDHPAKGREQVRPKRGGLRPRGRRRA